MAGHFYSGSSVMIARESPKNTCAVCHRGVDDPKIKNVCPKCKEEPKQQGICLTTGCSYQGKVVKTVKALVCPSCKHFIRLA